MRAFLWLSVRSYSLVINEYSYISNNVAAFCIIYACKSYNTVYVCVGQCVRSFVPACV